MNEFYRKMGRRRVIRMSRQQIASPYADVDELRMELRRAAQIANKRLRELDKYGYQRTSAAYRYITEEQQKGNKSYKLDTKGRVAFRGDVTKMTKEELQNELKEIEVFLDRALTSTVGGTQAHIKHIMASIKDSASSVDSNMSKRVQKFFKERTEDEIADFWEHSNIRRLVKMYGSDVAIAVIDRARGNVNIRGDLDLVDDMLMEVQGEKWTVRGLLEKAENWSPGVDDSNFLYNW